MKPIRTTKASGVPSSRRVAAVAPRASGSSAAKSLSDRCQIALIRGINVGRAKRVAMADLRHMLEGLGYGDVQTLLNSGNVVFSNPKSTAVAAAPRIEQGLVRLGVPARAIVLEAGELAEIVRKNPLLGVAKDPTRLFVSVLANPADRRALMPLSKLDWGKERLAIGARVTYVWCPEGLLASRLSEAIGRALGDAVTTRNWATMTKLHAMVERVR
jgi:uncharacterized protein (DUF1697 family)